MIKQIKGLAVFLLLQSAAGTAFSAQASDSGTDAAVIERVISAGGSISEWLVAVGAEQQLVGVDTTSLHPLSLQALPSVGYQRQLAAEGVLTLQPQVLFGSDEMGPPPVLQQLRSAGVQIETLPVDANMLAVSQAVRRIGAVLARSEQAEQALSAFKQGVWQQQQKLALIDGAAPRVLLVFSVGHGNPLTAGSNTVGDWLIKQAGGENLAVHAGFKALSSESMLALNPQVIIVVDRHNQGLAALESILSHASALQYSDAVKNKRIVALDPTLLVGGLGPRLPEHIAQLMDAFYPQFPSVANKN
ncbi:MAG: ABC transporter substrate-binding protein [Gammaproteobacteria bacterium]|nr:ABC transporter substrate-binding protein [Gammaproteobacteria bacterium]